MGKSKKRILHKGINDKITNIKREDALDLVVSDCLGAKVTEDTKDLISLFGLSAEELLENGAKYEDVLSLRAYLN